MPTLTHLIKHLIFVNQGDKHRSGAESGAESVLSGTGSQASGRTGSQASALDTTRSTGGHNTDDDTRLRPPPDLASPPSPAATVAFSESVSPETSHHAASVQPGPSTSGGQEMITLLKSGDLQCADCAGKTIVSYGKTIQPGRIVAHIKGIHKTQDSTRWFCVCQACGVLRLRTIEELARHAETAEHKQNVHPASSTQTQQQGRLRLFQNFLISWFLSIWNVKMYCSGSPKDGKNC